MARPITRTGSKRPIADLQRSAPGEAFALIQENKDSPKFLILDIRTPEEYGGGRLADAANLDFYVETFRESLSKLDMARKYLIYCRSGARARIAMEIMKNLGFREVYNLSGGQATILR